MVTYWWTCSYGIIEIKKIFSFVLTNERRNERPSLQFCNDGCHPKQVRLRSLVIALRSKERHGRVDVDVDASCAVEVVQVQLVEGIEVVSILTKNGSVNGKDRQFMAFANTLFL